MKLTPEEFRTRSPALFKRWLKTGKGRRWDEQQRRSTEHQATLTVKHPNRRKHWSAGEDDLLRRYWGTKSLGQFSGMIQRSQRAISQRARDLELGPANQAHGAMSLRQFAKYSGFSITKIKNTAKVLRLPLRHGLNSEAGNARKRTTRRVYQRSRTFAITSEQQEQLLKHMLANPLVHTR